MPTNINFVEKLDAGCDTQVSFNLPKTLSLGTVKKSFDNNGLSEAEGCSYLALNTLNQVGLLNQASLIINPSSFSENALYADLPANSTLGDLAFTRATDAWRTNSQGLIERTPWNLFRSSEQFNISPWLMFTGPAVLPNTAIAPNGTLTADTLRSSGGANDFLYQTYSPAIIGLSYTVSIYIKNIDSLRSSIWGANGSLSIFDINWSGSIISSVTNGATFVDVGNGWYRVTHTSVASNSAITIRIYADNFITSKSVFIWGAQLVEGSSALEYFPTTDRQDVPRIDYSLGGCPNILLEPQRTNGVKNSTMVGMVAGSPGTLPTSWAQGGGASGTTTRTIVGTGTENGLTYVDIRYQGSVTGQLRILTDSGATLPAVVGTNVTNGAYMKLISGTAPQFQIIVTNRDASNNFLSDNSGPLFTLTSTLTRYTYSATISQVGTAIAQPCIQTNVPSTAYDFTIRIAAPQMELGAYATSYIPTTSASVTRNADSITRNNIFTNGFITAAGGTWFVELRNNIPRIRDAFAAIRLIKSISPFDGLLIGTNPSNARPIIVKNIAGTFTTLYTTTTDTTKIAFKWNGTTADVFVNGAKVVSATSLPFLDLNELNNSVNMIAFINQMALFPTPLSDSELELLTGDYFDTYAAMAAFYNYTLQ